MNSFQVGDVVTTIDGIRMTVCKVKGDFAWYLFSTEPPTAAKSDSSQIQLFELKVTKGSLESCSCRR